MLRITKVTVLAPSLPERSFTYNNALYVVAQSPSNAGRPVVTVSTTVGAPRWLMFGNKPGLQTKPMRWWGIALQGVTFRGYTVNLAVNAIRGLPQDEPAFSTGCLAALEPFTGYVRIRA